MNEKPLLIGRLAKLSGVKPDTIRFYERSGLLPKPQRLASGYRVYDDAALKQIRFIRRASFAAGITNSSSSSETRNASSSMSAT